MFCSHVLARRPKDTRELGVGDIRRQLAPIEEPPRRVREVRVRSQSRAPIVRRGQLKLKAGVTTMRVLGDGYYSLAYRDDLARWDVVGPRVLTAGLHVNGPNGYVSGGLGAHLDAAARAEVAVELHSVDEIERRLDDHIARGVDVIKIDRKSVV